MKHISTVLTYGSTPLLLGLHWWTQHDGWLVVFGVLSLLTFVIGITAMTIHLLNGKDGISDAIPPISNTKIRMGLVYQVSAVVYLFWSQSFITMTVYLLSIAVMWCVMGIRR